MTVTLWHQETRQSYENTHCITSSQADVITPAVESSRLVILPFIITLRWWFSALSNSRTGEKAANFLKIVPYSSDIMQYSETYLKGNMGHKENFLYQKTLTVPRIKFSSTHIERNLPDTKKRIGPFRFRYRQVLPYKQTVQMTPCTTWMRVWSKGLAPIINNLRAKYKWTASLSSLNLCEMHSIPDLRSVVFRIVATRNLVGEQQRIKGT